MNPNPQLELDLYQTQDATSDFREWLLSFPPTPWATVGDLEPVGNILPRILHQAGQSHEPR
jgi:hypothetical protein